MNETPKPTPVAFTPERVEAVSRYQAELDRILPESDMRWNERLGECVICGALVRLHKRGKHYQYHTGREMYEILTSIFPDPEEKSP